MKNINKYLKSSLVLAALVYSVGTTIPMQSTYADEINTETVVKEWRPEGNIIAQGEDGVPWELYENGYLLFKPTEGKDTLGITNSDGTMDGLKFSTSTPENLQEFKDKIKAISFSGKTYLPGYPSNLFMNFKNLEFFNGENLDVSKTGSLWALFLGDEKLNNIKLENWDVSHIRTFRGMFAGTSIKKLDLSKWNFSEAPNSTKIDLFGGANSLEEITLPESFFNLTERDKKDFENDISIKNITRLITKAPEAYKNKVGNLNWIRKEDKKEIDDFSELKMNDKSNAGTWTRRYNKIKFIRNDDSNSPADIVEFSNKFTDESMLLPEPTNKVVREEETGDYYIFNGWIVEVPRENSLFFEKIPVKTISDVKELYKTRFKHLNTGKNDEYSTYRVQSQYEKKVISINTPLISNPNGNDEPELNTNNNPEYKELVSTNTPVDENGNQILPPVVDELPEFNGGVNPVNAPVTEKPEYNESANSLNVSNDNVNPINEIPEYAESLNDSTRNNQTLNNTENPKNEIKKERELPNTNSTSILTTLVSSVIGTLGLGYKSKRRK